MSSITRERVVLHMHSVFVFTPLCKYVSAIYCNIPRLYKCLFPDEKSDIFLIFAQNIDHGYTLDRPTEAVLTSTVNQFFFRERFIFAIFRKAEKIAK